MSSYSSYNSSKAEAIDPLAVECESFLTERLGFSQRCVDKRAVRRVVEKMADRDAACAQTREAVIAATTVGETYFLRHPAHFEWLSQCWLPDQLSQRGPTHDRPLRILSAACATGEEAYSIAAVLQRAGSQGAHMPPISIKAFDVNSEYLDRAQKATYGLWSLRGVELEQEADWLHVDGGRVRVSDTIRRCVDFAQHNLLDPLSEQQALEGRYDLIFCRNVLIYFHREAIERAYATLADALRPGGALIVGPSDPPAPPDGELREVLEGPVRVFRRPQSQTPTACIVQHPSLESKEPAARADRTAPSRLVKSDSSAGDRSETSSPSPRDKTPPDTSGEVDVCQLARRLGRLASPSLALDLLEQHLQDRPLDVEAHLLGALYAAELEKFELAFEWSRRAVFLAPNAPYAVFVLGDVCARMDKPHMARRYFRWAEQLLEPLDDEATLDFSEQCHARELKEVLDAQ